MYHQFWVLPEMKLVINGTDFQFPSSSRSTVFRTLRVWDQLWWSYLYFSADAVFSQILDDPLTWDQAILKKLNILWYFRTFVHSLSRYPVSLPCCQTSLSSVPSSAYELQCCLNVWMTVLWAIPPWVWKEQKEQSTGACAMLKVIGCWWKTTTWETVTRGGKLEKLSAGDEEWG